MEVLVTGAAGFVGYHLTQRLLAEGFVVCGIDNLNPYYSVDLKRDRLSELQKQNNFRFELLDLCDRENIFELFRSHTFDYVINLAAQAGVRYSLENPHTYIDSNIVGFVNLLEACRHSSIQHLIYASSSSVYGTNPKIPFSINDNVDCPISLYAATKKANELIAHTYSHLFEIPTTGLRFFTVYGEWGRPDMAYFKFTQAIETGEPINVYNFGEMMRDFTYIDDVVEGIMRLLPRVPQSHPNQAVGSTAPYKLYNIGNNQPVSLLRFIEVIEEALGKTAQKRFLPMQPGDVPATYADVDDLMQDIDFQPATSIEVGIGRFVRWYQSYYSAQASPSLLGSTP